MKQECNLKTKTNEGNKKKILKGDRRQSRKCKNGKKKKANDENRTKMRKNNRKNQMTKNIMHKGK